MYHQICISRCGSRENILVRGRDHRSFHPVDPATLIERAEQAPQLHHKSTPHDDNSKHRCTSFEFEFARSIQRQSCCCSVNCPTCTSSTLWRTLSAIEQATAHGITECAQTARTRFFLTSGRWLYAFCVRTSNSTWNHRVRANSSHALLLGLRQVVVRFL